MQIKEKVGKIAIARGLYTCVLFVLKKKLKTKIKFTWFNLFTVHCSWGVISISSLSQVVFVHDIYYRLSEMYECVVILRIRIFLSFKDIQMRLNIQLALTCKTNLNIIRRICSLPKYVVIVPSGSDALYFPGLMTFAMTSEVAW